MRKLAYRQPKSSRYYGFQLAAGLIPGLILGAAAFFLCFLLLGLLGMETESAGTASIWAGGGVLILVFFRCADRVTENRCVYILDARGGLFIQESSGSSGVLSYPPLGQIGGLLRRDIDRARDTGTQPETGILKVFRIGRTFSGCRVRCRVVEKGREKNRTLVLYRDMMGYDWLRAELGSRRKKKT